MAWREAEKGKGNRERLPLNCGGDEEDRTPDLRIANAALSQLSYVPIEFQFYLENSLGTMNSLFQWHKRLKRCRVSNGM